MRRKTSRENVDQDLAEQKLWRAVIANTIREWVRGSLHRRREAEQFLFRDERDYQTVCFSAGINPDNLRDRLQKIRERSGSDAHAGTSKQTAA